ncbi:hypothetical protein AX16_000444 [Volvariella volvacea WC 439]|nr:hypothetical protein AX16_000444 [Volvariella volvacea WC 439]
MSRTHAKAAFYAVHKGRKTGVYQTWDECHEQISGFAGAKYKKFTNVADAEAYVAGTFVTKTTTVSETTHTQTLWTTESTTTASAKLEVVQGKKRALSPDIDESGWNVVYSDGACKGNGQRGSIAGIGVWWGPSDPRNIAERCPGDQTNNRAELIAIIRVLETAPRDSKPLLIKTDSQYSINCFKTWLPKWKSNGWRSSTGAPVKNVLLIRYLSTLLDERCLHGQKVHLKYVKGHSGDVGNDGADAQANIGTTKAEVPEPNWEELEKLAKQRMVIDNTIDELSEMEDVPIPVLSDAEDDLSGLVESRAKIRRLKPPAASSRLDSVRPATPPRLGTQSITLSCPSLRSPRPSPQKRTFTSPRGSTTPRFRSHNSPSSGSASKGFSSPERDSDTLVSPTRIKPTLSSPSVSNSFSSLRVDKSPSATRQAVTISAPLPPPVFAKPIRVSVDEGDVDFRDYADFLLNDADLAKELEN